MTRDASGPASSRSDEAGRFRFGQSMSVQAWPAMSEHDRLPPQSRDAERSVLGSMLRDNDVIADVVQIVRAENFYFDAHQKIFEGIWNIYDQGQPVDLVILAEYLQSQGRSKTSAATPTSPSCGTPRRRRPTPSTTPTSSATRAMVRNLIHASNEILRDAYDQSQPADELLAAAERKILEIAEQGVTGQTSDLQTAMDEAYDRIDARQPGTR